MKECRRGFMRCRRREGPWGSHQEDARELKWDISVGSIEVFGEGERVEVEAEERVIWAAYRVRARSGRSVVGRERILSRDVRGGIFDGVSAEGTIC